MFTTTPSLEQRIAGNATMLKASPVAFAEPHEKGVFNIPVRPAAEPETVLVFGTPVLKSSHDLFNKLGRGTA